MEVHKYLYCVNSVYNVADSSRSRIDALWEFVCNL